MAFLIKYYAIKKPLTKYKTVPTNPLPNIIEIALALYFLSIYKQETNNINSIILKSEILKLLISAWNKPSIKIEAPADKINATTAGLSEESTV